MIYSRWGCIVEITGYCGKHKPLGFSLPVVIVRANYRDPETPDVVAGTKYYTMIGLRADDGINEIEKAVDAAPALTFNQAELKAILREVA